MPHHYLPTLSETANAPTPSRMAFWSAQPSGLLQSVGKGIDVAASAQARGVSSVPDVWARAVLFQSALHPEHPLHVQAVQEWRGLLTLLALRDAYGYPVRLVPVPLDTVNDATRTFTGALRRLRPAAIELETGVEYEWTDTVLILYDGAPIGAISPGSLVFTATGYEERLKSKNLDLCDTNGRLRAPTKATDEHTAHYVAEWVYSFYNAIRTRLTTHEAARTLGTLLATWLSEFEHDFGYAPGARINAPGVKVASGPDGISAQTWGPLGRYAIYQHLFTPLEEDDQDGNSVNLRDRSTLFLRYDRAASYAQNNGQPVEGVVVIHEDTLTDSAQIWGLRRRRSLGENVHEILRNHFDAPAGDRIAGRDLSKQRAIWIRPERYFLTDVLVAPREGTHVLAQGECAANAGGEYLLPFRQTLLDFFTPEEVVRTLQPKFEEQRDGSVRFSFTLPVGRLRDPAEDAQEGGGILGQFRTQASVQTMVCVSRTYRTRQPDAPPVDGEGLLLKEQLPVLDLFPRYLGPTWRRYFLFQSDADRFLALPYAPSVRQEARGAGTPHERKQMVDGRAAVARITEMHGEDAFPDGIELRTPQGDRLGLILTPRDDWQEGGLNGTLIVGIDFGTSNTNIFSQKGTSDATAWTFDFPAHLRPLTVTASGEAGRSEEAKSPAERRRDALLQAFFVPNREVKLPIGTLLDVLMADTNRRQGQGRMLLDYFIHFPALYSWQKWTRYNIKWAGEHQRVTKEFLESLLYLVLMQTTKDRVQTVVLRCTYPKSFSPGLETMFQSEWGELFKRLRDGSDMALLNQASQLQVVGPVYYYEGVTAARFFSSATTIKNQRFLANAESVCVDVGGGTTDIALISEGNPVHDASVLMAGSEIAAYIHRRPRVQEMLFSADAITALSEAADDRDLFSARLNLVLRREEESILRRLVDNATRPELTRLRHLIALKFGAVAFHVGSMLAAADQKGVMPGLNARLATGGIKLHWGGNASRLISWIDLGNTGSGGMGEQLLNGLVYVALRDAGIRSNASMLMQAYSPSPKSEAAGGAVVAKTRDTIDAMKAVQISSGDPAFVGNLYDDEASAGGDGEARSNMTRLDLGVICGENVTLTDGSQVHYLDSISREQLFTENQTTLASASGERLMRFITAFNQLGESSQLLNADTRLPADSNTHENVTKMTRDHFVDIQRLSQGDRFVEPVFIVEVKKLIGLVIAGHS